MTDFELMGLALEEARNAAEEILAVRSTALAA